MRSPGTAPPFGAKRTGRSLLMPRIGIGGGLLAPSGTLNLSALPVFRPNQPLSDFGGGDGRRRAPPCSRDTSRGRRRTAASRRGRPRPTRRRSRRARAAAARPAASRRNIRVLARWHSRSTMRRPSPAYCVRTATRVARRIAARALPVSTMRFPGRRRRGLRLRGDDLDLVAVAELRDQRRDLAVDLAPTARVADVGVDRIGEVDRRRAARQRDQLALGREAEHLVVEQLELGVLEELFRVGAFRQQLDGAAQPGIGVGLPRQHLGRRADAVLVERVRGDAVFGDLVHLARCGSAARRAACRARSPSCGSSGSRSASASRCSP